MNPYHQWLGVPARVTSPDHYELLGLRRGESSAELIGSAADERSRRVEAHLAGELGLTARRILDQIAAARRCLLDPRAKADYDRQFGVRADEDGPLPPHRGQLPQPEPGSAAAADTASVARTTRATKVEQRRDSPTTASPAPDPSPQRPARKGVRPAPRSSADKRTTTLEPVGGAPQAPHVPVVSKLALEGILAELTQAMRECRELYLACVPPSPGRLSSTSRRLAATQDRLHRGLLAKIYGTIAEADGRWMYEELRCAAALLEHVGVSRPPELLEQNARQIGRQAARLDWPGLLRPFREIPALGGRIADLETLVMRIANLIAKSDGFVAPAETAALHAIQAEFRAMHPPAAEPSSFASSAPTADHPATADEDLEAELPWVGQVAPRRTRSGKADPGRLRQRCLHQLDALVGLRDVKREIHELADWAFLQHQRRQAGLTYESPDLRFIFVGRPGTGKSLTAWIMSELLAASGALRQGQLVEVSGFDLVSRQPKDAACLVKDKLREAIGGTLLVDHAAALLSADEAAVGQTLSIAQQNLVAHAGRLAVVLADPSERLLAALDRHTDWRPLFHRHWHFADYGAGELGRIFQFHCDRGHYQVTRAAQIKLLLGFDWQLGHRADQFGWGHGVQRVFERAVQQLAGRIAGISPLTKQLLTTFYDVDIAISGTPDNVFRGLADPQRTFTIHCPGCDSVNTVGPEYLGIRVACNRCRQQFVCAWGDPIHHTPQATN